MPGAAHAGLQRAPGAAGAHRIVDAAGQLDLLALHRQWPGIVHELVDGGVDLLDVVDHVRARPRRRR